MRTKNFKMNIAFGVLVAFVLALGVQGIADAITNLKPVSEVDQSKRLGSSFEITFTVTLQPNAIAYNAQRKRISDHNTEAEQVRIDSSGYRVTDVGGATVREYRNITTNPTGTLVIDPRPRLNTATPAAGSPTSPYYVDSGRNVVDSGGKAVYVQTGSGTADAPWIYARAKANPMNPIDEKDRFNFNEESIAVQFSAPDGAVPDLIDTADGQPLTPATDATSVTMIETGFFAKLRNRVTLRFKPTVVGTYTITITDSTIADDFPGIDSTQVPPNRQNITFTLRVTPASGGIGDDATITPDIQRVPTNEDVEVVSKPSAPAGQKRITISDGNNRIRYEVLRGSGTLYVGTLEEEYTTPSLTLSAHQSAEVYIKTNGTSNEVGVWFANEDRSTPRATIIFEYRGKPLPSTRTPTPDPTPDPTPNPTPNPTNTITISPSTLSGTAGGTATITVSNPAGVLVNLRGSGFTFSPSSGTATSFTSTVTFPSTRGPHIITASGVSGGSTISDTTSVTVTVPGTLTARQDGGQVIVTASPAPSSNLAFRLTRGGVYAGGGEILPAGTGRAIPIGLTTGTHILTVSAEGYNSTQVSFTPGATQQQTTTATTTTTTTTQTGTPGVADSIEIDGQRSHSGTVNRNMGLRVQVTDANNRGVSDVRVTFRILAPGRGRLSQRGNGRAVVTQTDRNGYASASLTPLGGNLIVEAGAAGVTGRVTFIINVDGTTDTESTQSRESSTPPTSRTISPVVHVSKANRPPMLWIDGGKIYALVGADVEEFGSGVEGALNIAVGGGKVYWTEQTGESAGTINSANLDGSDVKELKKIKAVPMGIAVDTENRQLYWTNSRGRIQSADLDGSGIENVMLDLPGPMDIAVARGLLYWTQYDATEDEGSIGITNTAGRGTPKYISTGANMPGSIAIGGNKVYWTEMTGSDSGTINSANLNGSGATELNDIRAVPMGIGVDSARSKLYWTNSRGRVQSANLEGRKIQNVVGGLGNPGDMVLSNSISAPKTTPTTKTTAGKSKYDVNGDGSVDSMDVDALVVAVAAGLTDAKYDVNGDGKVDIFDVSTVSSKRSGGAAAAPTLLGTKLSTVQIDRLQEQIDLLVASNDRSPDAMRILIYLQQLIATARPEKTQLLANYPNPFNPETWIPYELAAATEVRITIYNSNGVVVRTLQLGQQPPGYYTDRERAAYWDGRNAHGETVASGVYFYQLQTDEISSLRKMVILK